MLITRGPERAVSNYPHALAVDQEHNLLYDDVTAIEPNGYGCLLGLTATRVF